MGGGTIFKAVTKEDMQRLEVLWPPEPTIATFEDTIKPIFLELEILVNKNANLRHTRDLLLPKLISGEIRVKV
jgi:type I restriction enzyme S subunit